MYSTRKLRTHGRYRPHNAGHRQNPGASAPRPTHLAPAPAIDTPRTDGPPLEGVFTTLLPELQRAVREEGYVVPTPVQVQSIPHVLARRDLYGCAQTGTGKTAAFALPILQLLVGQNAPRQSGRPQVLILAPTRELAAQIGASIGGYGRYTGINHTVIFGGVGQHPQVSALRRGVNIVVATPGRLLDLLEQRVMTLDAVGIFVLDEGDRMLDMGFLPDIWKIVRKLPARRQSMLFSATLPEPILQLAGAMVKDPVHVTVTPEKPAVEQIAQKVMFVQKHDKLQLLTGLLRDPAKCKVMVFAQMKHAANKIAEKLDTAGIPTVAIHGNKSQNARTHALTRFKSGGVRVLVATDIAARGLDVTGVSHVINYDLPMEAETYVHRIGRSARAGATGDAVSFCSADERDQLRAIERLLRKAVPADLDHEFHAEAARQATGAAARPPPRGGQRPHAAHNARRRPAHANRRHRN